jgi:hypothetical protein
LLDAAFFHRIEQVAAGRAAGGVDLRHQLVQPRLVAAARHAGVVAVAREALGDMAADAGTGTGTGTGTEDQADGWGHGHFLRDPHCHYEPAGTE